MWQLKQFITWTLDAQGNKLPTDPKTGRVCNAHDPAVWVTHEGAKATGRSVAFVFTEDDPYFFFDVDDCKLPDGRWSDTACWICQQLAGCYVEISQSGEGLHIFGRIPADFPHSCDSKVLGTQFYTSKRFVALTGTGATGDVDHTPDSGVYQSILSTYYPATTPVTGAPSEWTTHAVPEWDGPDDDDELVTCMLRARSVQSVVNGSVTLADLWEGNEDALSSAYPDIRGDQGRAFDWSMADAALVQHLAFWTGKNCERMDKLWGRSALGQRDKYHDRQEYRHNTIVRACGLCTKVYRQRRTGVTPADTGDTTGVRSGFQYYTPQDQQQLFAGCVYVRDQHRIFTPDGDLLKPEQFKASYGGRVFALDAMGDKSTRNAWEAFTESQALDNAWAHTVCFRPELEPGSVIPQEGRHLVNTYVPIPTEAAEGDVSPFLDLLGRLLPVSGDRDILLAYMAATVQYPGVKFQWCPLLQGAQGNGKSFLGTALTACIGEKYTHSVDPKDIGNVFNYWVNGKLLAIIEEIHAKGKIEVIDSLKPLITNMRLPVQGKGRDQTTGDNRVNFLMFSNHRDAIRKTRDDRRFAVFYTAQQSYDDIVKHGMDGGYFPELYEWGRQKGFKFINQYLRTYAIPAELNPAINCHRAPETSSTTDAIRESMGSVEQRLAEVCQEGRPGFVDGWVSSMALDRLLQEIRARVPINKRRGILEDLGYIQHPALYRGRLNTPVIAEGGKPVLYVLKGHVACNLSGPKEVYAAYCQAQGYLIGETVGPGVAVGN